MFYWASDKSEFEVIPVVWTTCRWYQIPNWEFACLVYKFGIHVRPSPGPLFELFSHVTVLQYSEPLHSDCSIFCFKFSWRKFYFSTFYISTFRAEEWTGLATTVTRGLVVLYPTRTSESWNNEWIQVYIAKLPSSCTFQSWTRNWSAVYSLLWHSNQARTSGLILQSKNNTDNGKYNWVNAQGGGGRSIDYARKVALG